MRVRRSSVAVASPARLSRVGQIEELGRGKFDLVVIGGGITGAWLALDATSRGLRTALVEKDDFASGTSSKSSKMIHGGLRYIEQRNFGLVYHSLKERARAHRNAPHLVQRLPFLFPVLQEEGVFDPRTARAFEGLLWMYDALGGWRIGRLHERLSRSEALAHCPTLPAKHLRGGLLYYDARVDDARLTMTVVRTAAALGATVLNGARVLNVRDEPARPDVLVDVDIEGDKLEVRSEVVIAAGGVWNDRIAGVTRAGAASRIRPGKGAHIFLPWSLVRNDCTVTVPIPGRARRATVTRWGNTVCVGTTDTDYTGSPDDVHCTRAEMEFLLEGVNHAFELSATPDDVLGSCAGLRPLVGSNSGTTMEMRRNHEITSQGRVVALTGGKLTTGRYMAEQAIDRVLGLTGRTARCRTARLKLLGGAGYDAESVTATGGLTAHLGERYGTEAWRVHELIAADISLAEQIVPDLPYVKAEVIFAARHELARSVDDVLSRRTRARLFARKASISAAEGVGRLLQDELGLTAEAVRRQVSDYRSDVEREGNILLGDAS